MDGLKGRDVDDVIGLMQRYPASPRTTSNTTSFFLETIKLFDSDELVFLFPSSSQAGGIDLSRSFTLQGDRDFLCRYADYFWRYDPVYQEQLYSDNSMLAFRNEDVMPLSHLVKSKFYYDFMQPQNMFSELVIRLYFRSQFVGAISLFRSKQRPSYDTSDVKKAKLLVPYIVNAIDVGDLFSANIQEQRLFENWLESQSEGIIFLGPDFETLYHNSKADIFCLLLSGQKPSVLSDTAPSGLYLPDVIIQDCRCLVKTPIGQNGIPGYDNRIVNVANQMRYHIQYFTVRTNEAGNAKPSFIIIINDLNRYTGNAEEIILGQAKLSNREAMVAKYVGMGWTNKEIADSLHSSPFTIQNQLKSVFEKTGLKNRTQLANLMKFSDSFHSPAD